MQQLWTGEDDAWAVMDGAYRYSLGRAWNGRVPRVCWIMLNPSTADSFRDDPTIRRCIGFSKSWGYSALVVVNLFAWRATEPADTPPLRNVAVGPSNDDAIVQEARASNLIVAAWGTHGSRWNRDKEVLKLIGRPVTVLGLTKDGHPRHPLYVRADTKPDPWNPLHKEIHS